ncbi:hypothetical protein KQI86_00060 [Clostridium sp. MSJ-11]|uniref:DUF5673 domain-containing protein n=1 Tax=Clostridium mobile TaxID=2841512 RepID=A0ABS6EE43_9CLOT|nr:hypothetical protein [Clostridium mobile]MBU5482694.1 hypothetical protein [Clostridium mobile]
MFSFLILINLIRTIIRRRKCDKVLLKVKYTLSINDIGKILVRTLPSIFMILLMIMEYENLLDFYRIIKSREMIISYSPQSYLKVMISIVILVISLLLSQVYNDIYNRKELIKLHEDGIYISGIFDKWEKTKSFNWVDNKLILRVETKLFSYKWLINREVEVPNENKEHINRIIKNQIHG